MKIIPAIDIFEGKCARLTKGQFDQAKYYNEDPFVVAQGYKQAGVDFLHLIDLDAARSGNLINLETVKKIAQLYFGNIEYGGGIRGFEKLAEVMTTNIKNVIISSLVLADPENISRIAKQFGLERITLSLDLKAGKLVTKGWLESSPLDLASLITQAENAGVKRFIITDTDRDGTNLGFNLELLKRVRRLVSSELIMAGGLAGIEDIRQAKALGIDGVITGKALLEGRITLEQILTC